MNVSGHSDNINYFKICILISVCDYCTFIENKMELESLELTTTGQILTPEKRRSDPNAIVLKQRQLKNAEKETVQNKTNALKDVEDSIINEPSIFKSNIENDAHAIDGGPDQLESINTENVENLGKMRELQSRRVEIKIKKKHRTRGYKKERKNLQN